MNAFTLLNLPARPALSRESVDQAFRSKASDAHPDKPGGCEEKFAELVSARDLLLSPARRLRHLAEQYFQLPLPTSHHLSNPELAFSLSALANQTSRLSASPIPKTTIAIAARIAGISDCHTRYKRLAETLEITTNDANHRLTEIDSKWPDVPIGDLTGLAADFSYLEKWQSQLESTRLKLAALKRSASPQ